MSFPELASLWAEKFGLALTPLFGYAEPHAEGEHAVLLDGGFGSFALSQTREELWKMNGQVESWSWSSNLPHHVTITDKVVAVTRWDRQRPEILSRRSVESQSEAFYSYLVADRVRSTRDVVEYALSLFRRTRSLVAAAKIDDSHAVEAFLGLLSHLIRERAKEMGAPEGRRTSPRYADLMSSLPQEGLSALLHEITSGESSQSFRLFPSLAVRHAGSEIFQEAHFEFLRAPSLDLFGWTGPAETKRVTRGGAHFTPPALARSVVEQTLGQVRDLMTREVLTILDPACGSGAFLHEALRTLQRLKFGGRIVIRGRDISRAATAMASFVVRSAREDWPVDHSIDIDITCADSLTTSLPAADVVLMNPPFIAWPALGSREREILRDILGPRLQGRGDMSMAFVTRALSVVAEGGALGVLLPASLLTLAAAEYWRKDLLERADLTLLASMGEYGLFSHALVQVAAAVFAIPVHGAGRSQSVTALVASDSADATGNALRSLRKGQPVHNEGPEDDHWRLFTVPVATFRDRSTWRLTSPRVEAALRRIFETGAAQLGDLFEVRQGVRTGDNAAFLLDEEQYAALPKRERQYFRPAVVNESLQDGTIQPLRWLFYPYSGDGPLITSEEALMAAVPRYAAAHLVPRQATLRQRPGYEEYWWTLARARERSWGLSAGPRLVSKYFGSAGGFAVDLKGEYVVVQGFAWFPRWAPSTMDERDLPLSELLHAYCALLNSERFSKILSLFAPHVAGGQFDLSPRYVNQIPVPNFVALSVDERAGTAIRQLALLGRNPRPSEPEWAAAADRTTSELYGVETSDLF